jgi:hypothetical protein
MPTKRSLTYPTDHLLAVFDDPGDAASAAADLGRSGFATEDITILRGGEGIERLEPSTGQTGRWTRLLRAVQYVTMDQMPDFPAYVAALRDGRAIVAVRVTGAHARRIEARDVLERHRGHFMNFFGRYATEELVPWRGPELPMPEHLRR